MSSKNFWKTVERFISNKTNRNESDIILNENNKVIKDRKNVANTLNEYFISIAEYTASRQDIEISISEIINKYENHISMQNMRNKKLNSTFTFEKTTSTNIRQLNSRKPMGIDTIPPKIIKILNDNICDNIESIVNSMIIQLLFPGQAKVSSITPVFKKDNRMEKKNCRPISVLSCLSKVLEKIIFQQMGTYFGNIFSPYLSGFRKQYGYQHVLMRMTEKWRIMLGNKKIIAALSMDLSKAFDSLPHDTLIAKIHAYGFEMSALKLIYSFLIDRTQTVKVKGERSIERQIKSGVPQGSLLGVSLFNIYLNDIFDSVDADLFNFADDNDLLSAGPKMDEAKALLINETEAALNWTEANEMIVNPEKFHLIFLSPNKQDLINQQFIEIRGISLKSETKFTLLGVDIDNQLTFHSHINNIFRKAENQINALKRLSVHMGQNEKMVLMKSFILSNFNYCPLVRHFCGKTDTDRMEKIQKRAL